MDVPRRRLRVSRVRGALLLLPIAALIVWLVAAQLPTWGAPHIGWLREWFVNGSPMPTGCLIVASLRANQGVIISPDTLRIDQRAAGSAGRSAISTMVNVEGWALWGTYPVRAVFDGKPRTAWLTSMRKGENSVAPAALAYIDDETAEPLFVALGVDDTAAVCDFNLRRALRDTVLSPPFVLLVGYTGLLIIYWLLRIVVRRRAAAKG